jgi:hypothetical protein
MSTVISKNVQVGNSGTAAQNFTWYQPASPDGTVRLGVGNSGVTTGDVVTVNSSGVTVTGSVSATTISGAITGGAVTATSLAVSGATTTASLAVNSNNISAVNSLGFRNRIINGDMRIDQRNAGASVSGNNNYTLDRWQALVSASGKYTVQQDAGAVTPPAGFTDYLGVTSSSAYSVSSSDYFTINQRIEGFNCADLNWGSANAQTVTLSFVVRSSLTGTFGGSLRNSASNRSYPFSYAVSSANTWEYKTITIAGDTSGTWLVTNGVGIDLNFSLGAGTAFSGTAGAWNGNNNFSASGATSVVGTNGATFYITGVQLEAGTVASPFERVEYGAMLRACQRYFLKTFDQSVAIAQNAGRNGSLRAYAWTTSASTVPIGITWQYPVEMRAAPTITTYNPNNTNSSWRNNGNTGDAGAATTEIGTRNALLYINATLGATDSFIIHASATAEL